MDAKNSLIKATKTQTIPLHPFDMMTGVVNIIYICYYKNTLGSDTFMPTDMLRDSFFTTLAEFPILLGRLQVDGSGKTVVVVDENNLNMPEFKETQSDIHFGHLQSAGFSWSTMPQGTVAVRSVATVGDQGYIKLANVHIVRLKDNSGVVLTVGLSHYVVDGIGYCTFMNQWAKNCTHLQNGTPNNSVHARTLNFDRQTVARCLPSRGSTVDQATRSLYSTDGYMARWLAWLTPESRGSVFSVLMALDNYTFLKPPTSNWVTSIAVDIRGRIDTASTANYTGNMWTPEYTGKLVYSTQKLAHFQPFSVSTVQCQFRKWHTSMGQPNTRVISQLCNSTS
ncbi:hypothetical protein BX661DRAFT_205421 [Kickxella alabastrina]|uniref:uncharacterized protein n=1 Tax=Kickxella alabastrina TaxID=61397 RepID=UPI0022204F3E|nr:uncharacterized protein BX661DRAFT_205421 [Kickxella alabastrina]KAI7827827.1 hypothetical protein BX661DRAFT_205421 [Kickxella alabastrina]